MTLLAGLYSTWSTATWQQYAAALIGTAVVWTAWQLIYELLLSPLSHFPGPFWAKLTDLWHVKIIRTTPEHYTFHALHEKYGPVVRIGPSKLSITDPNLFRTIYSVTAPFSKTDYYDPFVYAGENRDIFTERNEALHGKYRRQISAIFSSENIKDLDHNFDGTLQKFISQMDLFKSQNVDLGQWLERLLFDCICDVAFQQNMGLLDKVSESNIFGWAYDMIRETHQFGSAPFLTRMAQRFSRLLGAMDVSTKYENNIVDQSIDRYLESQKDLEQKGGSRPQRNLASRILQVQASGKGETKLTDVEVRLLLQLILIAGTTDAVTWLNSIFYHLMRHPSKMDKLVRELKQRRADGLLSDPCTAQQTAECSYLNAVLNESIRLFPSVAGILPREVPKGGIEIAGRHVPAGVTIGAAAFPLQRSPDIYGAEPNSFVPERWIENPKPEMQRHIMGFGLGSRTCLGRNLAWMEMRKIVATLVQALEFEPPKPDSDWTFYNAAAIHQQDFYARVKRRAN